MRHLSALVGSIAIIGAYVLVRACVYHFFPITSHETWFWRDTLMSIPRFGAFVTLLLLNRIWNESRFDLPLKEWGRALRMGFVPMALWFFYFSGGHGEDFAPYMKFVGFFTSLLVGAFEEYAFRGPLLSALRQRLSLFMTIVLSNLLFAVYHVQAQSVHFWVAIFLTGVICANLRLRGLSLGWLAVIHGVTDAFFFFFPSINPKPSGPYGLVLHIGLLLYAVMTFPGLSLRRFPKNVVGSVKI